jgi:hypothetical protein
MRKSVAIPLLLLYIIASSGVAIRAHYSSGKLKSVNLILDSSPDKPCTECKNVCNDKVVETDTKATSHTIISVPSLKDVLKCVGIVSHGFIEACDDADTMPICPACPTADRDKRVCRDCEG